MKAGIEKALVVRDETGKVLQIFFGAEQAEVVLQVYAEYAEGSEQQLAKIAGVRELLPELPKQSSVDAFMTRVTSVAGGLKSASDRYASTGDLNPPETGFALCYFVPGPNDTREFYFSVEALKEGLENPVVEMPGKHVILGMVNLSSYPFPKKRTWLDNAYDRLKQACSKKGR